MSKKLAFYMLYLRADSDFNVEYLPESSSFFIACANVNFRWNGVFN